MPRWRRLAGGAFACGVVLFAVVEIVARQRGIGGVALYAPDPLLGYRLRPSQAGAFSNHYRWAFNERSQGVARPFHADRRGILLVGDSIVLGGNRIDQPDKLGPLIERRTGCTVWPVSAASWGLINELNAIRRYPDYNSLPRMVFVSNSADFAEMSVFRPDVFHPTRPPVSVVLFAAARILLGLKKDAEPPPTVHSVRLWRAKLRDFFAGYRGHVTWLMYPKQEELPNGSPKFGMLRASLDRRVSTIDVWKIPGWNASMYRDYMHPNVAGYRLMADVIAADVGTCPPARGGAGG